MRPMPYLLTALLLTVAAARAELPTAILTAVNPPGAKRGTTVEVTIVGKDLEEPKLIFSDPRITASYVQDGRFKVVVPDDAGVGTHDVRVVCKWGVSNPRAFVVGTLNESINKPGNTSPAAAKAVAVGEVVNAVAEANAWHYYRVPLKAKQRISVEVDAGAIDSKLAPSVIVADPAGRDRVTDRDGGGVIEFTAPADGDHLIKVADLTYRGGGEFFYRLAVHAGPKSGSVWPPAGLPGTKQTFTLDGRSFDLAIPSDPDRDSAADTRLPSSSVFLDGFDHRVDDAKEPVRIGFATAPVIMEDASRKNDSPAAARRVTIPCEVAGHFRPRASEHWFTFDAAENTPLWIEVISHRLGHPTAPLLLVQRISKDEKGVESAGDVQEVYESPADPGAPELRPASRDPICRLDVKQAGTYRVLVRNLFASEHRRPFRLSVRRETPDFRLAVIPASPVLEKDSRDVPLWTPVLRQGGSVPLRVAAQRRDGFGGEIQVNVEGLPPGVTASPATIGPSATSALVMLTAAADAQPAWGPIRVTGSAVIAGAVRTRLARPATVATSTYDTGQKLLELVSRRSREIFLAVAPEQSPMTITLAAGAPALETCVFNKLPVPVKLSKNTDFTGPTPLKLAGHPLVANAKEVPVDPKADAATLELDLVQSKLPAGEYLLHVETLAKLKYKTTEGGKPVVKDVSASFYSQPVRVRVRPAPITLTPPAPVTIEVGGKAELPVSIQRLFGFADAVELVVVAPNVKGLAAKAGIEKDQSQAKLPLAADAATPAGDHAVMLEARLKLNGQAITVQSPLTIKVTAKAPGK